MGGLNCFIFGLASLGISLSAYFKTTSLDYDKIVDLLKERGALTSLSYQQFKGMILISGFISFVFFLTGWGLLLRKEWARRLIIYFSFFFVLLAFLSIFFSSSLIKQAILQIIYPGILIIYFTNKKVETYFQQ